MLRTSGDAEIAGIAAKMDREEVYHRIHAEMWVDRLLASEDGRARLDEAIDELWPYALGVLDEELRPELVRHVEAKLGSAMSEAEPIARGRHEAELGRPARGDDDRAPLGAGRCTVVGVWCPT